MIRSSGLPLARHRGAWLIGCRRASCWPAFTARRKDLGLTRSAIARELARRGCPTNWSTVRSWEQRGYRPSERRCQLLAAILRVSKPAALAMFGLDFGLDPREQPRCHRHAERRPVVATGSV